MNNATQPSGFNQFSGNKNQTAFSNYGNSNQTSFFNNVPNQSPFNSIQNSNLPNSGGFGNLPVNNAPSANFFNAQVQQSGLSNNPQMQGIVKKGVKEDYDLFN